MSLTKIKTEIEQNPEALAAVMEGSNTRLLEALSPYPITMIEAEEVVKLFPDSHWNRYMRGEFVDPALVKLHHEIKAATDEAIAEDKERTRKAKESKTDA